MGCAVDSEFPSEEAAPGLEGRARIENAVVVEVHRGTLGLRRPALGQSAGERPNLSVPFKAGANLAGVRLGDKSTSRPPKNSC